MVTVQPSNRRWLLRLRLGIAAGRFLSPASSPCGPDQPPAIFWTDSSTGRLSFDNLSGDPNQEYFAAGMTHELTKMLAKNSNLPITSRTSVMRYEGTERPLPESPGNSVWTGPSKDQATRSADKAHTSVQLIQVPSDAHVWAESYDRNANDITTLPPEIAQSIAKKLNSAVLRPAPTRSVSAEKHDAYRRGRYRGFRIRTMGPANTSKRATELQPDYALGWAGLSMTTAPAPSKANWIRERHSRSRRPQL